MKIIEKKFDAITGEETVIERLATTAEIKAAENFDTEMAELEAKESIKATEKAALLAKLGITEDEAKLLLS
jgi:hypothetical protein